MYDIWAFLLQTLTASGVAVLLLAVKALFRDKLPPKWHFAIWGILGITMLLPTGFHGRYVLFNWPLAVETLKTMLAGEYTYTQVLLPFPVLPAAMPRTFFDWLFVVYFLGVGFHLVKYVLCYIRLRFILRRGWEVGTEIKERIEHIAAQQKVRIRRIVTVPGLPSAFVCGVFRPILALPADTPIDDKILLHELLHLKQKDTVWSIVICVLRSIHWCNPLLIYCAGRAGNDLEARCDQRVLELLEGEERRDYGRILLAMANDRYARTPGATCANNGGKNIRRRIEAITRFKLYPAGMQLVSVCAAIVMALPLILGVEAVEVYELKNAIPAEVAFASARTNPCTTTAGAFDTYGKAVLDQNPVYRAMCAPADMQKELAETGTQRYKKGRFPYWDNGLESWPDLQEGYCIYNLKKISDTAYEGLIVFQLNYRPDGKETEFGRIIVASQNLRVEKEGHRWVTIPLDEFQWIEHIRQQIGWGAADLPAYIYSAEAENFRVEVQVQTIHVVDNTVQEENDMSFLFGANTYFDTTPKPHAEFTWVRYSRANVCTHLGTQEERDRINHLGLSITQVAEGAQRPVLSEPQHAEGTGSSNDGTGWTSVSLKDGWEPVLYMNGSGSSGDADFINAQLPDGFAVDLYINGEKAAELDLTLQEGGPQ